MDKRNRENMHKIILELEDMDIQWLFSPIHVRQCFKNFAQKHKDEKNAD